MHLVLIAGFASFFPIEQCLSMYACSSNICDALCCCCYRYHALLSLHYKSHLEKTAATKKLAQEVGIFLREAESCLEPDVFLDKYLRWNLVGSIAHSYYNGCLPMPRPPGKRSVTMLFTRATDSLCLSET